MTRAKAIEIARTGDFRGCELFDIEEVIRLTGSKKAVSERNTRIAAYGTLVKDERGNLKR